jgi:hypothetical protein
MREDYKLINLIKEFFNRMGKAVPGKKALQKLVYFSQVEGLSLGFDYILYKYGPYSYELEDKIKEMEFFEFIQVTPDDLGYKITCSVNVPPLPREEKRIVERVIQRYGSFSPRELELFSTVHFIAVDMLDIYKENNPQEIVTRVKSIKRDKYSWEEIESAYQTLKEWQLI